MEQAGHCGIGIGAGVSRFDAEEQRACDGILCENPVGYPVFIRPCGLLSLSVRCIKPLSDCRSTTMSLTTRRTLFAALLLVASALPSEVRAQIDVQWTRTIPAEAGEAIASVTRTSGGDILIAGKHGVSGEGFIRVLDAEGQTLLHLRHADPFPWQSVHGGIETQDGSFLLYGSRLRGPEDYPVYYAKLNETGETQWWRSGEGVGIDGMADAILQVFPASDGGFLMFEVSTTWSKGNHFSHGYALRTNSLGEPLWDVSPTAPYPYNATYYPPLLVEEGASGDFLILTTHTLLRVSGGGELLDRVNFYREINCCGVDSWISLPNGRYAGAGGRFVVLDSTGVVLSEAPHRIADGYEDISTSRIVQLSEEHFLWAAAIRPGEGDSGDVLVVILDSSGSLLASRVIDLEGEVLKVHGLYEAGGGIILVANTVAEEAWEAGSIRIVMASIEIEDGFLGTSSEAAPPSAPRASIKSAYPVPANGAVTIVLSMPRAREVRVEVFDTLGRRLATVKDEMFATGDHRLTIPLPDIPGGAYIIRAQVGEHTDSKLITVVQ